jgi:hypothetical protein
MQTTGCEWKRRRPSGVLVIFRLPHWLKSQRQTRLAATCAGQSLPALPHPCNPKQHQAQHASFSRQPMAVSFRPLGGGPSSKVCTNGAGSSAAAPTHPASHTLGRAFLAPAPSPRRIDPRRVSGWWPTSSAQPVVPLLSQPHLQCPDDTVIASLQLIQIGFSSPSLSSPEPWSPATLLDAIWEDALSAPALPTAPSTSSNGIAQRECPAPVALQAELEKACLRNQSCRIPLERWHIYPPQPCAAEHPSLRFPAAWSITAICQRKRWHSSIQHPPPSPVPAPISQYHSCPPPRSASTPHGPDLPLAATSLFFVDR